jgi:hypothetical protein
MCPLVKLLLLRDRLTALEKDLRDQLFPNLEHSIPSNEWLPIVFEYFRRRLEDSQAVKFR